MLNQTKFSSLFFNTCFDKNQLKNLIAWVLNSYGEKKTVDFLEKLKQVGFHEATQAGVSLGLEDLQIPTEKASLIAHSLLETWQINTKNVAGNMTGVEKSQQMIDIWNQMSEDLRQKAVQNFRNTNPVNPVFMMAFSGARGNISQVRQLVAMRGLMADPQGAILEFPIQSNFREGLTITEYLISCYGARKGLVDTALRTATSGYLTRRLVDAVQHIL
jgi:DNA-directed RNA polymerase subunit beta'